MTDYFEKQYIPGNNPDVSSVKEDPVTIMIKRSEAWARRMELQTNSIAVFMREVAEFDADGTISSQELYERYRAWCIHERLAPDTIRTLCYRLKHGTYGVKATVLCKNGKQCRGFRGIRIKAQ